ncbi:spore germination protein [Ornithinibacillus halophilus]|uniref:Spore germination protein n=1 Tax=Ornithinibacillus halophilus TaxID=930117 RepID=A0A1M5NHA3_9BACI|nr:spore germination protein [Ornithinibacillus halophilus]SHG88908.1 spore germination protein [Ornithinibacillus halophilus]
MVRSSLFKRLKRIDLFKQNSQNQQQDDQQKSSAKFTKEITTNLDQNLASIKQMLGDPGDLVVREFLVGSLDSRAAIVYISGLVDEDLISNNILKTIQSNLKDFDENVLDKIYKEVISITDIRKVQSLDDVSLAILNGSTAFYLENFDTVLVMGTNGGETRSIQQPESETLIRGPRDGFVESIETNAALIRRDIKDPNLRLKSHVVGKRSKQKLVLCYIDGIVNPELVKEVNRRLETIDIDYVSDSSYVEQWIEDSFLSPFPQLMETERPDKVSLNLVRGKVAILVDGTPFAIIAPITLGDALHSPEDYNQRWITASLLRLLRYLSAFFALFLPSLYIALVAYHPGMLPSTLTYSIAATREGVPFPAAIEALIMAITFEILHEAGIRLPKVIGQTIGIVGGLVIGEAAVSAGIVSPIMVIVTALTAIASFSVPSYSFALTLRTLRFAFMIAASFLGLFGIILVYIMINIHIVNLKSLGIPYSTPFSPTFSQDWKDLVIRAPFSFVTRRPKFMKTKDEKAKDIKPE